MPRKKTTPDIIASNVGAGAKVARVAEKRELNRAEARTRRNPISNLGEWAHPPKSKRKGKSGA